MASKYRRMLEIKRQTVVQISGKDWDLAVVPDAGGRVFAELGNESLHKIGLNAVANPVQAYNNFGGNSFWPAPEGGVFGLNYRGDEWYVQDAINSQPFELVSADDERVLITKDVKLINRAGTLIEVCMTRAVSLSDPSKLLAGCNMQSCIAYITSDSMDVINDVTIDKGLIACWSLEQFDTTAQTCSFCCVPSPQSAINFDYYDPPKSHINYCPGGFTFKTDGRLKGQIGISSSAGASCIGFYDMARRTLCIRENLTPEGGVYFNIADNDQPEGPYSASDCYSIFNSDADMSLFELETIGPAHIENNRLLGSTLVSATTFALFSSESELQGFLSKLGVVHE